MPQRRGGAAFAPRPGARRPPPARALRSAAGAHVRSYGAIRSFWFFLGVTVVVDLLWLLAYSPLRPLDWDMLMQLSRKDQLSVLFSVLAMFYKLSVIYTAIRLQSFFDRRERLIKQMERDAGVGANEALLPKETSSGEPADARSLAAQAGQP